MTIGVKKKEYVHIIYWGYFLFILFFTMMSKLKLRDHALFNRLYCFSFVLVCHDEAHSFFGSNIICLFFCIFLMSFPSLRWMACCDPSDLQPPLDRVRSASTNCLRPDSNSNSPDRERYSQDPIHCP